MTKDQLIAYAAGLLDGEGCIAIKRYVNEVGKLRKSRTVRHQLCVEINQVRPEAIMLMKRSFGGRIRFAKRNGSYSGRWFWEVSSDMAADFLRQVLPCLQIKTDEASIALAFQSTKVYDYRGHIHVPMEVIEQREWFYHKLQTLKRKHNILQTEYEDLNQALRPSVVDISYGSKMGEIEENREPATSSQAALGEFAQKV